MGWLAAQGAIMAIGHFIGLVCSVIGLFFGHIILFDSIALGIATFLLLLWLRLLSDLGSKKRRRLFSKSTAWAYAKRDAALR